MAFLARLLFAVFVTGGALPAGGPSAVHGFDIVEEDEKTTQGASAQERSVRQAKRGTHRSRGLTVLEVPSLLGPTRPSVQAPTWMRPRRTPPPDDDDAAV
jgi:hypothetical protein